MNNRVDFIKNLSKLFGNGIFSFISEIFIKKEESIITEKKIELKQLPPGATDRFYEKCINCGDCIDICPHKAIKKGDFPYMNISQSPCYLCDDVPCSKVCSTGALKAINSWQNIKLGLVGATFRCENYEKSEKICYLCQEICPFGEDCIEFNGFNLPIIKKDICTGCGLCIATCPQKEALCYFNL